MFLKNKKSLRLLTVFILTSLLGYGIVFALNSNNTGYKTSNSSRTIDAHNICKNVKRTSGDDVFVPTKTSGEWSAFISNNPSGISVTNPEVTETLNKTYYLSCRGSSNCAAVCAAGGEYVTACPNELAGNAMYQSHNFCGQGHDGTCQCIRRCKVVRVCGNYNEVSSDCYASSKCQ